MALWTAQDAALASQGRAFGNWSVEGVSIDTRTLEKGDLFVALKAARDGHEFVAQALAAGAGAALVSHVPKDVPEDAPLLIVDDVLSALEDLGRAARARASAKVLAVTGSVGKTSTKEMLRDMLSGQGKTHASVASYNNHWGVPLTLARMPKDTKFAVIEIGMNHPGEISPLVKMARPHVSMVTTVAAAHLEAFGSIEGIALEKAAIIDGLIDGGVAVFNADIDTAEVLEAYAKGQNVPIHWFGQASQGTKLVSVITKATQTLAQCQIDHVEYDLTIQSAGRHFAMNALGALRALGCLGASIPQAAQDLSLWSPVTGRGAREIVKLKSGQDIDLIDDSYNANPASLGAALDVLAASHAEKRIAILGDMKELGADEIAIHADIANLAALKQVDLVHTVGPLMKALHDALPDEKRGAHFDTAASAAETLPATLSGGETVLIKASLSMGLSQVVDAIRKLGHSQKNEQKED